jgi:hypothetical protein
MRIAMPPFWNVVPKRKFYGANVKSENAVEKDSTTHTKSVMVREYRTNTNRNLKKLAASGERPAIQYVLFY